ncbi:MAG: glycosyltransferase family 39 protein [Vicinamibacteria bacterium]|nr:glycosyltransferase family 39 protein [Vicinamibacteria bacterium]
MSRGALLTFLVASALTLALVSTKIRGADEIEYFSHLRSAVFDRDLDFKNEYEHFYKANPQGLQTFKETFLDRREPQTNRPINFAPIGSAVTWAPFYLTAHALVASGVLRGPADGFSAAYTGAVAYGSAILAILGFLIAFRTLKRYLGVTEGLAVISVLAIWFGTPALYYMTVAPAFAHAPSIFAVSLLFFLWLRAREKDGVFDWVLTGLAAGLAMLIREQGALFLIAPGLDLGFRLIKGDVKRTLERGISVLGAASLVFVPQLLSYHALNGTYGPTQLVQRKMDFGSPHFFDVLMSPGHGLLLWTPLLIVSFFGLLRAVFQLGAPGIFATVALLAQIFINGSVLSWHQAGAFGSRRFVDSTVLFIIGFAFGLMAFTPRIQKLVVVLAIWWNVSLMVQFGLKLMDRQQLDWPGVAVRQVTAVPQRILNTAKLYITDPEALVRSTR